MKQGQVQRIKTISEFHHLRGLPNAKHPLISVIDYSSIKRAADIGEVHWIFDFYVISLKKGIGGKMYYGQQEFDFNEGLMVFMAPNQVFRIVSDPNSNETRSGWMLLIHPDFLWNTSLANTIKNYDFFDYSVNEALFLSDKEQNTIDGIVRNIKLEHCSNIDKFSKQIIVSQINVLLSYSDRFYNRQFITREKANHQILDRLENLLNRYFHERISKDGLPTVQSIAEELHVSPKYLSTLLKVLTGKNTQQHIHDKLIEVAKEKLSTTNLSISEIAYTLGFEHSQSFSKLFKAKTNISPMEFRQSFD